VRAGWRLLCRLRAWPGDASPDPLEYPSRLAWGNTPVDASALPGRCRLLAGRAFAALPGADPAAPALLAAMGARVRACAGPGEVQAGGAEVLVHARGKAAPAGAAATDVARVLVRPDVCRGSQWVLLGPMGIARVLPVPGMPWKADGHGDARAPRPQPACMLAAVSVCSACALSCCESIFRQGRMMRSLLFERNGTLLDPGLLQALHVRQSSSH